MFDDELLQAFVNMFYGYGDYRAKYWFVGMEEGGGKRPKEIAKRLEVWHRRGRKEIEDVAEYHREIDMPHFFFSIRPSIQRTWSKLIHILLKAEERVELSKYGNIKRTRWEEKWESRAY